MSATTIDPNKYVSIGLHPNDVPGLSPEEVKIYDERLENPAAWREKIAKEFEIAIAKAEAREAGGN